MTHCRQNGSKKFVQPKLPFITQMSDIGIYRDQGDIRIVGHFQKRCLGAIEHMIFHASFDDTADIKTMDKQTVFYGSGVLFRKIVFIDSQGSQRIHSAG